MNELQKLLENAGIDSIDAEVIGEATVRGTTANFDAFIQELQQALSLSNSEVVNVSIKTSHTDERNAGNIVTYNFNSSLRDVQDSAQMT